MKKKFQSEEKIFEFALSKNGKKKIIKLPFYVEGSTRSNGFYEPDSEIIESVVIPDEPEFVKTVSWLSKYGWTPEANPRKISDYIRSWL